MSGFDITQFTSVLYEYEKLKGAVPALKAEYDSILKSIEKAKELAVVEMATYEDIKTRRMALAEELGIQKAAFVAEKASALEEIAGLKVRAEEALRNVKLMKVDVDTENAALQKAKEEYRAAQSKLEEKVALIAEVVKKLV